MKKQAETNSPSCREQQDGEDLHFDSLFDDSSCFLSDPRTGLKQQPCKKFRNSKRACNLVREKHDESGVHTDIRGGGHPPEMMDMHAWLLTNTHPANRGDALHPTCQNAKRSKIKKEGRDGSGTEEEANIRHLGYETRAMHSQDLGGENEFKHLSHISQSSSPMCLSMIVGSKLCFLLSFKKQPRVSWHRFRGERRKQRGG